LIVNESKTDESHSGEIIDDDIEKIRLLQNELKIKQLTVGEKGP